jgi:hypothetical protein
LEIIFGGCLSREKWQKKLHPKIADQEKRTSKERRLSGSKQTTFMHLDGE